jgi:hypothetical protein
MATKKIIDSKKKKAQQDLKVRRGMLVDTLVIPKQNKMEILTNSSKNLEILCNKVYQLNVNDNINIEKI